VVDCGCSGDDNQYYQCSLCERHSHRIRYTVDGHGLSPGVGAAVGIDKASLDAGAVACWVRHDVMSVEARCWRRH